MALIYGQQTPQYNSHDRQYIGEGVRNQGGSGYYIQSGSNLQNGSYQSPYLMSMAGDNMSNRRHPGASNIIRRGRNYLEEYKNQNSGYQVRLPKITNLNK